MLRRRRHTRRGWGGREKRKIVGQPLPARTNALLKTICCNVCLELERRVHPGPLPVRCQWPGHWRRDGQPLNR
eukprot:3941384-Rhodomonas_salina.4